MEDAEHSRADNLRESGAQQRGDVIGLGTAHSMNSSMREKILEHLFVGELLSYLWRAGVRDMEVLRAEVDAGGFDLAIECNGILRHIQLKASHQNARTARVEINTALARKTCGCVIWIRFDADSLRLGPFLWLGNLPGARLPELGDRIGHHTKGNSAGLKTLRPHIRTVNKGAFRSLPTIEAVAEALFGTICDALGRSTGRK
jgi:hypothetical protein